MFANPTTLRSTASLAILLLGLWLAAPVSAGPVSVFDDANGEIVALSVFGDAVAYYGVTVSGTGHSYNAYLMAVSLIGSAEGVYAVSGTGSAYAENLAISGTGTASCHSPGCIAISGGDLP